MDAKRHDVIFHGTHASFSLLCSLLLGMARCSPQQRAHSLHNLQKLNVQDCKNQDPRSSPTSAVQKELAK
ncbi:hypothetical protein L208DRAFT_1412106, partial [Tricholoma matsutake]